MTLRLIIKGDTFTVNRAALDAQAIQEKRKCCAF
jgi:hypothetical protein